MKCTIYQRNNDGTLDAIVQGGYRSETEALELIAEHADSATLTDERLVGWPHSRVTWVGQTGYGVGRALPAV